MHFSFMRELFTFTSCSKFVSSTKESCQEHPELVPQIRLFKLSKPQPNFNTTVGFYTKITLQSPPPPPLPTTATQTQCQQYLSCYWPNFDETLKVSSWEHLEHIYDSQHDNCQDNICPGNICPYQKYLRCY